MWSRLQTARSSSTHRLKTMVFEYAFDCARGISTSSLEQDLLDREVQNRIRSAQFPLGKPGLTREQALKVEKGNQLAKFMCELIELCIDLRLSFWIKNPAASFLWSTPKLRRLSEHPSVGFWSFDFCVFGAPWRKRTKIFTNTCLRHQNTFCRGGHVHQILRGRSTFHRCSWTKVAGPYPRRLSLCIAMALALLQVLVIAQSLRNLREVPALRVFMPKRTTAAERAALRAGVRLEAVSLVEAKTEKLEVKLWEGFLEWLQEDCGSDAARELCALAATLAPLLQLYGEHLFSVGATLSAYRHIIAFAQRRLPDFKFHSKVCWDYVSKWEAIEPLVHRAPIPEQLCDAMASLALAWGWPRFALILLIAYRGILRLGEVARASRSDLVLPSDLLSDTVSRLFFRVRQPKTGKRGGGRQQHASVRDEAVVRACESLFGSASPDTALFPLSVQTFRRRWDQILDALEVPKSLGLTPGGVRGGAAVSAYHHGTPIYELLWQMRIQHIPTLQHYLQEMAAENVLGHLSSSSKRAITSAASCLPVFLAAV
ncbi:UVR8 [Symbiodinium sp. CCMP2592]|nr:UVR8 [Symbiodinium sp. CCMP2592]